MTVWLSGDTPTLDGDAVRSWLTERIDAMLGDLEAFVALESPSGDVGLLAECASWLRSWFTERLGTPECICTKSDRSAGDTLVYDFGGVGPNRVILLGHYDTVWPSGTLTQRAFRVSGDIATGPGVFDMKAGWVQAVWAIRALDELGLRRPGVRVVATSDEEVGSVASRDVVVEACRGSTAVLVFEPSAEGALKTSRKGASIYEIEAHGIASHAGLNPKSGASAVTEIVRVAEAVLRLADEKLGTTINLGMIGGGSAINVVAEHASLGVDVRTASLSEAERVDRALKAIRPLDPRVGLTVTGGINRPAMERTPEIAGIYELARRVGGELGLTVAEAAVGGFSDGNFASQLGLPVLDGLGAIGGGAHAVDEHVSVLGMIERAMLTAGVLHALS